MPRLPRFLFGLITCVTVFCVDNHAFSANFAILYSRYRNALMAKGYSNKQQFVSFCNTKPKDCNNLLEEIQANQPKQNTKTKDVPPEKPKEISDNQFDELADDLEKEAQESSAKARKNYSAERNAALEKREQKVNQAEQENKADIETCKKYCNGNGNCTIKNDILTCSSNGTKHNLNEVKNGKSEPAPKKAETPAKKSEPKTQPTPKQNKPSSNDGIIVKGLYEQSDIVCKKVCGEASNCELHSFTGDSNTIYCPGKGNAWVDNNGNDYETGKPVKFNSKSEPAKPKNDQEKKPEPASKPAQQATPKKQEAPKKQEQPAKSANPDEYKYEDDNSFKDFTTFELDALKRAGNRHSGFMCEKTSSTMVVCTNEKNRTKYMVPFAKIYESKADFEAAEKANSAENPKNEPEGKEEPQSDENNELIEQIKSEAQQILDAYNKRKEELEAENK